MFGFKVELDGLNDLAAMVGRATDDLVATQNYGNLIDSSGPFTGLLEVLQPRVERAVDQLLSEVASAVDVTDATAGAITSGAQWYAATDTAQAADLDAQLADTPHTPIVERGTQNRLVDYADVNEPTDRLVEPPGYDELMQWKASIENDLFSVTSAVRELVRIVFGVDIFEPLLNGVSGDWREVRRISDRCANIGRSCAGVADNVARGRIDSAADWEGDAADSARSYLGSLIDGLNGEHLKAHHLASTLLDLSNGAFGMFEAISGLLSDCIDAGVEAVAAASVAASAAPIPGINIIVTPTAAGWATYKAVQFADAAKKTYDAYNDLVDFVATIDAGLDLIHGGQLTVPDRDVSPLPAKPYDFPFPA